MIDSVGLAWSLRIIGIASGVMNLLAAILLRSRNKIIKPTQHGFDVKLLRRYDVLLLLGWLFVGLFGYIVILYSYSNFAHSSIGLSKERAAEMSGFLNLGTALGRPLTGLLSDRFGRIETSGFITFVCGISIFAIWIPDTSYGLTVFYAIFVGAILGVFWVVRPSSYGSPKRIDVKLTSGIDNRPSCCRGGGTGGVAFSTIHLLDCGRPAYSL